MSASEILRSAAVVVLNHNGSAHMRQCLEHALAMSGLAGPSAVVVADNGSTDASLDLVEREFPGVRTIALGANLGFAQGNNAAAAAVDAEYVMFLNNDTAAAPDVLTCLAVEIDRGAVCSGARLVDWSSQRLDFDGGGATFSGHGHPLGHGHPTPSETLASGATLFCSGAAMLVRRDVFLAIGGFAPETFAYYEDVDLGWRLRLAGHNVVHVPSAVVRHRGGGTADVLPTGRSAVLHERNALANVVRWFDGGRLKYLLPAALSLAAVRAGAELDVIDSAAAVPDDPTRLLSYGLPLPEEGWPGWPAVERLEIEWPRLSRSRSVVQATRRAPDVAVLPLMVDPLAPVPASPSMKEALDLAEERFKLRAVIGWGDPGVRPPRGWIGERYAPGVAVGRRRVSDALRSGGVRAAVEEARTIVGTGGIRHGAGSGDGQDESK